MAQGRHGEPEMTKIDCIRRSVVTTHQIDELPSIPTQSWVQQCANALCSIHPRIAVASLVCTLQPSEDRLSVYSSGACFADSSRNDDMGSRNPLALQDRCERLTKLGIPIPESALQTGIVAPIQSLLSNWPQTPIARLFSGTQLIHPVLQIVPIKRTESSYLCLINLFGFASDTPSSPPSEALALISAIHTPLRLRAHAALEFVNNPRAWLTDREQHVLELLIEGQSVRSIAEQLGRSAHTVHDHVKNLHKKIGASSRGELIAKAIGHTPHELRVSYPDPVTHAFPSDQNLTELKPERLTARPLR